MPAFGGGCLRAWVRPGQHMFVFAHARGPRESERREGQEKLMANSRSLPRRLPTIGRIVHGNHLRTESS